MANLAYSDVDMSDFEKLADDLEFENKQYVKMIEKEKQCILSLQSQIEENKAKIQRVECDISRMDEDTMQLHKQFVQSKETLKNLKDTYNVMMDHELALSKQLESLKIKSEEERQYYQEQVTNYSKIKDDYLKKYESFPLAIELRKEKEKLAEKQRDSEEIEAIVNNLEDKIKEKEAVLDSKVLSRMIIKIARLKLSTLQTEKEIDKCLVEKTMLLEQLKEIQRIQQPPETEMVETQNQEVTPTSANQEDDIFMDCEEGTNNENGVSVNTQERMTDDCAKADDQELSEDSFKQDTLFFTPMENKMQGNREPEESNDGIKKSSSNTSQLSDEAFRAQDSCIPNTTSSPGTSDDYQVPTKGENIKEKSLLFRTVGIIDRTLTSPQAEPVQRAVHKIPTFKPLQRYRMPLKEISKDVQAPTKSVLRATTAPPKVTIPSFTRNKFSIPKLNVPSFSSNRERYTDSVVPVKGSVSPMSDRTNDDRKQEHKPCSSIATSMTFSLPKATETLKAPRPHTVPDIQSFGQKSINHKNMSLGGTSYLAPMKFTHQNGKDSEKSILLTSQPPILKNTKYDGPVVENKTFEHKQHRPSNKELKMPQNMVVSLNDMSENIQTDVPMFKQSMASGHASKSVQMMTTSNPVTSVNASSNNSLPPPPLPPPPTTPKTNVVEQNKKSSKPPSSYGIGSVFNIIQEDSSQSPTAFSLINLVGGGADTNGNGNHETPFLSFGDSSSDVCGDNGGGGSGDDEERPTSLFSLFSPATQTGDKSKAKGEMFSINFGDDAKDENNQSSFFNFDSDANDSSGGGFFAKMGRDSDDDDSGRNKDLFNIF